jgi:hypothetical protein
MNTPQIGPYRFFVIEIRAGQGVCCKSEGYQNYLTAAKERKQWARLNGGRVMYEVIESADIKVDLRNMNMAIETA